MYTLNELYRERAAKKSTLCDTAVRSGTLNRAVREKHRERVARKSTM